VSEHIELEEEEFDSRFSGQTIRRLVTLLRPYTLWVLGFLTAVLFVSGLDSYFTYLSKRMVDEGITAGNWEVLLQIVEQYAALIVIQAGAVFGFIFSPGCWARRSATTCARSSSPPAGVVVQLLQQDARRLDHVARHVGHGAHRRPGDVGLARRDLGVVQHHHVGSSSCCSDQLAVGADRDDHHPAAGHRGRLLPEAHSGAVPRGAQGSTRRSPAPTTRTSPACASSRRWLARTSQPARVRQADRQMYRVATARRGSRRCSCRRCS
jgi:hypothetical protein